MGNNTETNLGGQFVIGSNIRFAAKRRKGHLGRVLGCASRLDRLAFAAGCGAGGLTPDMTDPPRLIESSTCNNLKP